MKSKNILLFQRILPSYRIPVFKKLYEKLGIVVCYSNAAGFSSIKTLDKDINFPAIKLNRILYKKSATAMVQNPLPVLIKVRPDIVISEGAPSYLSLWLLLFLKIFFRYKLVLWSHGVKYDELENPFKKIRSRISLWLFNRADGVLLYSDKRAEIVRRHVNKPEKVFVARNTLDTVELGDIHKMLKEKGEKIIKKELGFNHKFNLIFIGRLLPAKGLSELTDAFTLLPDDLDVALHIIGDGPEREKTEQKVKNQDRIKCYGSIYDSTEVAKFLFASDLMVMPGYIGLSVVHAFAFGCPVITLKSDGVTGPKHSPEVEYIVDGYNGFLAENSLEGLSFKIEKILRTPLILAEMKRNALQTINDEASISRMITGFENVIDYLKK